MPTRDEAWKARFDQLVKYRQKHGHTKVLRGDDEALYIWCYAQRRKRRDNNRSLTRDRVEKLNSIGFWDQSNGTPSRKSKRSMSLSKESISKQKKRELTNKNSGDVMMKDVSLTVVKKRSSLKTNSAKNQAAIAAAAILGEEEQEEVASATATDTRATENGVASEEEAAPTPAAAAVEEEMVPNKTFLSKSFDTVKWFATGIKHLISF